MFGRKQERCKTQIFRIIKVESRERKERERERKYIYLGPAYGRRVSVRAVAGAHFLPFKMFLSASPSSSLTFRLVWALFQSLVFVVARFWSKDAVAGRTSARKVSPSDQGSNPGGGGSYSSIAAGLSPGDGGLLSSVAAGCVAGKGRLTQLCRRWLLFPKGGSSQSSALSAWYPYEF